MTSSSELTWIHISDTHFGAPDMTGEFAGVINTLVKDIAVMKRDRGLQPDLLFYTGDIAFGERAQSRLEHQYVGALNLVRQIQETSQIASKNVFLVPGNHDVNRSRVDDAQTSWLDSQLKAVPEPTNAVDRLVAQPEAVQFQRYVERLENYAAFVQKAGLKHLLQNPHRLTYTHRRQFRGIDLAITGLNTAWSSCRDCERGKLWLGKIQINENLQVAKNADLAIALGHHPPGWFNEFEDPSWYRSLVNNYNFYLHGHEHDNWVIEEPSHVRIAAGAVCDRHLENTGYNIVRLDFEQQTADVFMRQYDARGGGWIPRCLFNRTDDTGCWRLRFEPRPRKSVNRISVIPELPSEPPPPAIVDVASFFSVASAIQDETRFVGRRHELRTALSALRATGAAIAIFGMAGVGKSSLVLELARIASGIDRKLCTLPELASVVPKDGFCHHVIYYSCRAGVDINLEATLCSVLQDRSGDFNMGCLMDNPTFRERCEETGTDEMLKPFSRGQASTQTTALATFQRVGSIVFEVERKRELVLILDEFNVVQDKAGFATLIKAFPQVKFVIVGTGADVRLLVQDHASIPRQLAEGQIRLLPMSEEDLMGVISNEEKRSGHQFSFSFQTKRHIARAARGVPFFVHFVGRYALDAASRDTNAKQQRLNVELRHVQEALQERLINLHDLEDEYIRIIAGRWERELTLKLLSEREEDTIALVNLRDYAKDLGIRNLDTGVQALVKNGVLTQQANAMYQFRDTRLRVYAQLREPLTDDARSRWLNHTMTRAQAALG